MARSWKDMIPSKITSVAVWFKNHKTATKAIIEEVDSKPGISPGEHVLCIRIDVDSAWIRINKTNAIRLSKKYGDDVDKWIAKSVLISADEVLFKGQMVDSMKVEPMGK